MQDGLEWISSRIPGDSYRDPATRLFETELFLLELDREFLRSQRSGDPFTLAFLQLDALTDREENLPEIGKLLETNIREVDLACRYRTDLFALLLLTTSAEVELENSIKVKLPLANLEVLE